MQPEKQLSPWDEACALPSHHGIASDTFAHLCKAGAYVLSTPRFLLLARPVEIPVWMQNGEFGSWDLEKLLDPYSRFENPNAWSFGVLTGDLCAAYECLIATAGEFPFLCWQNRKGQLMIRKSGPNFLRLLQNVKRRARQLRSHCPPAGEPCAVEDQQRRNAGCAQDAESERAGHEAPEGIATSCPA